MEGPCGQGAAGERYVCVTKAFRTDKLQNVAMIGAIAIGLLIDCGSATTFRGANYHCSSEAVGIPPAR